MDWSERIGRRLKPRDLHIFLAVAEHGSMAKAAESLAISRPVVSKTIADLERILDVRLLDRTGNGVEPTQFGHALLKRSLAVFDELRQSVKEIEFLADPSAAELRVGFGEVAAAGLVPAALDELSKQYPRLSVRTEQGNAVLRDNQGENRIASSEMLLRIDLLPHQQCSQANQRWGLDEKGQYGDTGRVD